MPFTTVKGFRKAVPKDLVEKHGKAIKVESY
jgi:hypothetical protein